MFPRPHQPPLETPLLATLPDGTKVKQRLLRMRACNELNAKGKFCLGHLKRWYEGGAEVQALAHGEIYRCERCFTLYLPNPGETPRTGTMSW